MISRLRDSDGSERVGALRTEMQATMDMNAQVYRTEATLKQALSDVQELQRRYRNVSIQDKGRRYNTDLLEAIELGFLLDLAEVLVLGPWRARSPVAGTPGRTTRPATTSTSCATPWPTGPRPTLARRSPWTTSQ